MSGEFSAHFLCPCAGLVIPRVRGLTPRPCWAFPRLLKMAKYTAGHKQKCRKHLFRLKNRSQGRGRIIFPLPSSCHVLPVEDMETVVGRLLGWGGCRSKKLPEPGPSFPAPESDRALFPPQHNKGHNTEWLLHSQGALRLRKSVACQS